MASTVIEPSPDVAQLAVLNPLGWGVNSTRPTTPSINNSPPAAARNSVMTVCAVMLVTSGIVIALTALCRLGYQRSTTECPTINRFTLIIVDIAAALPIQRTPLP